jgi:hypothetical protein
MEEEIQKLKQLLYFYENENLQHLRSIESLNSIIASHVKRISDLEKIGKSHVKKIKSLENAAKFEKIASDGILKKSKIFEADVMDLKHRNEMLSRQFSDSSKYCNELEETLFDDRSNRLQLLHQNNKLMKDSVELERFGSTAEKDAIKARENLLTKLQQIDSFQCINSNQKELINAQSMEIISLTKEVIELKEKISKFNRQNNDSNDSLLKQNKITSLLQTEIFRLRKELIDISKQQTNKSQAFLNTGFAGETNQFTASVASSHNIESRFLDYELTNKSHQSSKQEVLSDEDTAVSNVFKTKSFGAIKNNRTDASFLQEHENKKTIMMIDSPSTIAKQVQSSSNVFDDDDDLNKNKINNEKKNSFFLDSTSVLPPITFSPLVASVDNSVEKMYRINVNNKYNNSSVSTTILSPIATLNRPFYKETDANNVNNKIENYNAINFELLEKLKKTGISEINKLKNKKSTDTENNNDKNSYLKKNIWNETEAIFEKKKFVDKSLLQIKQTYLDNNNNNNNNNNNKINHTMEEQQIKEKDNENRNSLKNNKKSLFVGSGLGLKHNEKLEKELKNLSKGTAKSFLKKLLANSEFDD